MPVNEAFSLAIKNFTEVAWPNIVSILITIAPIALFFFLMHLFWDLWVQYVRAKYFFKQKRVLLEIKLPKDLYKSPHAMELFLNAMHNTFDPNWYKKYWEGEMRPWWSLEMVSIEGQVKFFIWLEAGRRNFVETSLYAQFPGIEVKESQDYSKSIHFDPKEIKLWATEFKFTNKNDAYPIKTYVDYGLDKDPKEELKVDPLVPLLEYLGGIGPNQQVWIQILLNAHIKDAKKAGNLFKKTDAFKDNAEKLVNELMKRDPKTKIAGEKDEKTGFTKMPSLSKGEENIINAIERRVTKPLFDVGIRAVYIAKKDFFDPSNIGAIVGSVKQFSADHMNGFRPGGPWGKIEFPWQDFHNIRKNRLNKLVLMAYKRRSYFYPPFEGKIMVMNTEEVATLFHFPGQVAGTPTLSRIPSRKSEAPTNLPI